MPVLEKIIAGKDDRLVRDLRADVPAAFIAVGNLLLQLDEDAARLAECCFRRAIELGVSEAHVNLGRALSRQSGRQAEEEAVYQRAVALGCTDACNNLANLYCRDQRYAEAEQWYRRGVAAGDGNAAYNLAQFLQTRRSDAAAEILTLFRQGAAAGIVDALFQAGKILVAAGDYVEAAACYLQADEQGHPAAGREYAALGEIIRRKGGDTDRLTAEAIKRYRSLRRNVSRSKSTRKATLLETLRRVGAEADPASVVAAVQQLTPAILAWDAENADDESVTAAANREFDNVAALLRFFQGEQSQHRFVYRGQTRRHDRLRQTDMAGNVFVYENITPSDFRFVGRYSAYADAGFEVEYAAVRTKAELRSARFMRYVIQQSGQALGPAARRWFEAHYGHAIAAIAALAQTDLEFSPHLAVFDESFVGWKLWRLLWALAQHYECSTALIDVTYSPAVAAWFATNEWDEARPRPLSGRGVIYRLDLDALQGLSVIFGAVEALRARDLGVTPRMRPFVQDLREIPAVVAARPRGQQGGSVYGLDGMWLLGAALASGTVECFEFNHTASPLALSVERSDIIPPTDPFLALAEEFRRLNPS